MHRKFEINWININDVGPDLRCKGQMVAPVHLNMATILLTTSLHMYSEKTANQIDSVIPF